MRFFLAGAEREDVLFTVLKTPETTMGVMMGTGRWNKGAGVKVC